MVVPATWRNHGDTTRGATRKTGLVDDESVDVMGNCGKLFVCLFVCLFVFLWDLVGHPVSFQPFRDEKNDQRDLARNAIMTIYVDNYDDIFLGLEILLKHFARNDVGRLLSFRHGTFSGANC